MKLFSAKGIFMDLQREDAFQVVWNFQCCLVIWIFPLEYYVLYEYLCNLMSRDPFDLLWGKRVITIFFSYIELFLHGNFLSVTCHTLVIHATIIFLDWKENNVSMSYSVKNTIPHTDIQIQYKPNGPKPRDISTERLMCFWSLIRT